MLITGCNASDVAAITGEIVDNATIAQALSIIELYTSLDLSNFAMYKARNRKWLQMAIAYQAAWMDTHVDLYSRDDVADISQDGLSFTLRDGDTLTLAPLAKKAVSRVSWSRPRTVRVAPGRQTQLANRLNNGDVMGTGYAKANPQSPYTEADFEAATGEAGWL